MSLPPSPSTEDRLFLESEPVKPVLSQGGGGEPDHECRKITLNQGDLVFSQVPTHQLYWTCLKEAV